MLIKMLQVNILNTYICMMSETQDWAGCFCGITSLFGRQGKGTKSAGYVSWSQSGKGRGIYKQVAKE